MEARFEDIDKQGNVVHGSFLDNFDSILKNGISPPSMLPDEDRPQRFFGNLDEDAAECGTEQNYISTFVIGDWNNYSLSNRRLWSPFFYYFIVTDYSDWGSQRKSLDSPWYIHSTELTLYNQSISNNGFLGLVLLTDADFDYLYKRERGEEVFLEGGKLLTTNEIMGRLEASLSRFNLKIPLFDFDGGRLEDAS